jgi:hypothetical protein
MNTIMAPFTALLRKRIKKFAECSTYLVMNYKEKPEADATFSSINNERVERLRSSFGICADKCLSRTKEQLDKRFPPQDIESVLVIFLDPRTAPYAYKMIEKDLYQNAWNFFIQKVEETTKLIELRDSPTALDDPTPFSSSDDDDDDDDSILLHPMKKRRISLNNPIISSEIICKSWIDECGKIKWLDYLSDESMEKKVQESQLHTILDLCAHADPLKWFQNIGRHKDSFKPIGVLATVHLASADSSSFQESVFSSSGANMSKWQTKMSHELYEKRCVLYHNRKFIQRHIYGSAK